MIGARALMLALEKEGVKEVFGLPGVLIFLCMMNYTKVTFVIF